MVDVSITTTNTIIKIITYLWLLTLGRSIIIMIGGSKLFKKANKGENSAYFPLVNLFTMLEVAEISTYYGILLFVPVINCLVLIAMSIKIGKIFNAGFLYKIGLIVLPFVFYPLLSMSNCEYKGKNEELFKALDYAKNDSINLLTQEEINAQNNEPEPEKEKVDSIFKGKIDYIEKAAPYKAVRIEQEVLDKLNNDNSVSNKSDHPVIDNNESTLNTNKTENKFVVDQKNNENVEFIDL